MSSRERNVVWKKCYMKCGVWNQLKIWFSHLLDNLSNCLMNLKNSGDSIIQVTPVESPEFFRFMRQLLKLSSKCEDHILISNTALHITPLSYHLLLLRVPWHMLKLPPYTSESDDSCFRSPFFFSTAFFQLQNPFFVKARSTLDEVSIPLWSAFKQVWQQAASLLSSWCNPLNRSNHAVCNDLFVTFLLPEVFEILQLVWTIWYVSKALMWRAGLCLYRFQFAGYCCLWFQIIYIYGSFFDSVCFFAYTRLCVTNAWFYTR